MVPTPYLLGMTSPSNVHLLTIPQTAEALACSRVHVYRLIADGTIRTVQIARKSSRQSKTRVPSTEIERIAKGKP